MSPELMLGTINDRDGKGAICKLYDSSGELKKNGKKTQLKYEICPKHMNLLL